MILTTKPQSDAARMHVWAAAGLSVANIAVDIAHGANIPSRNQTRACKHHNLPCPTHRNCPAPINYLANGDRNASLALPGTSTMAGGCVLATGQCIQGACCHKQPPFAPPGPHIFRFHGCDFQVLSPLATAKAGCSPHNLATSSDRLRGFDLPIGPEMSARGLSLMFSPWTDFCLLCWAYYDFLRKTDTTLKAPESKPTLIFGKDYYSLSHEYVLPGEEWGLNRMLECNNYDRGFSPNICQTPFWNCLAFWGSLSPIIPSVILPTLGTIDQSTRNLFTAVNSAAASHKMSLETFIGRKRILVYNVWPWFRCGQITSGNSGIHSNPNRVPAVVSTLRSMVNALNPERIATLGSWSYSNPIWGSGQMLDASVFPNLPIGCFNHPSPLSWNRPWTPKMLRGWNISRPIGHGSPQNAAEFTDFINYDDRQVIKADTSTLDE